MNISSRHLPPYVILGLLVLSTLVFATSLAGLHVGTSAASYSMPVLFNQANAAAQKGQTGQAIADYERARLLAPADPDIAANLQWVREHAGLASAPASWLDRTTSWASPNTMALLGWLGLVLTGVSILSVRYFKKYRFGFRLATLAGIVLLGFSVLSAIATWQKIRDAIVITSEAPARISPVTNGEVSFKLHSGETVTIAGHYNDFVLVKNSAGHSGWVAQNDITPLIPN